MHFSTHSSSQLQTVFGGEFVQEQHSEEADRTLSSAEVGNFVSCAIGAMRRAVLDQMMSSLRKALSLK